MNKQPKDYADKSGLLDSDDWEYKNKESYMDIAKYFLFIVVAAACGFIFVTGVLS